MKLSLRGQRGFTLIELIQVTGTIAVVALVLWVIVHFIVKFW